MKDYKNEEFPKIQKFYDEIAEEYYKELLDKNNIKGYDFRLLL